MMNAYFGFDEDSISLVPECCKYCREYIIIA